MDDERDWSIEAPHLSADILMSDGRLVRVADVPPPKEPASAGKITVSIPYPADVPGGAVTRVIVRNEDLGMAFPRDIFPAAFVVPGDTPHVPLSLR